MPVPDHAASLRGLLDGHSLEMTARDVPHLVEARRSIPAGTRLHVTYLEHESLDERLAAARAVHDGGMVPVPHLAARRLRSSRQLHEYLAGLAELRAPRTTGRVMVVAGDPHQPHGPYDDSLALLRSGALPEHGVRHVDVAGYPQGHPHVAEDALWEALTTKAALLRDLGLDGAVVTQFGFDVSAVLTWLRQVRDRGVELPVRVGVPGPASIARLLRYAARFGVATSAGIARRYGFSLAHVAGSAGPDRFVEEMAARLDPGTHGRVGLHFYTFGGVAETARWIAAHGGPASGPR